MMLGRTGDGKDTHMYKHWFAVGLFLSLLPPSLLDDNLIMF